MSPQARKEELIETILQLTDKAFRELLPMVPKEWLRLDLTMPQLKAVFLLFIGGPSRMSEIATALDVSLATATGVADRLVERGILLREGHPEDRRVVICRLSEKGERLISGLWQLSRERAAELMSSLPSSKLQLMTESLKALLHASELNQQGEKRDT